MQDPREHEPRNFSGHQEPVAHRKSMMDCDSNVTKVPWVDLASLGHVVRNAHESEEDEQALLSLFLRDDNLHRRGVRTGDEDKVSDGQGDVELVLLDGLVIVGDGNEVQRAILSGAVNSDLEHLTLRFWRIPKSGRGDPNENDHSYPLWGILQEFFEGSR